MLRRNTFRLSHKHDFSVDMGYLVPVACIDVLPGDTFMGATGLLARVAPMVNPVMHKVDISIHHWFVPNRILWEGWEDYITGADDTLTHPTHTITSTNELLDHMGMHPTVGAIVDALPIRAFNKIWNTRYRDQDLQTERAEEEVSMARVAWGKDYFTTARPQPQQGDAIELGFSAGSVPVTGIGKYTNFFDSTPIDVYETGGSSTVEYAKNTIMGDAANTTRYFYVEEDPDNAGHPNIRADLTQATGGINLDDMRRAFALQRVAEARMRYGHRYEDYLRFYGINPRDGRLDRPEYLGGGSQEIDISEVLATAEGTNTAVGDLAGHGIAAMRTRKYRKMFEEHGWFMTLAFVRPRTQYLHAMPRKFTRTQAVDYWHREFEALPWQQVKETEIYAPGDPNNIFGYVPKYEEYRSEFDYCSGSFRTTELDWHYARNLQAAPTLNSSFIECTPTDRVYSDTSMPEILATAHNSIMARRLVRQHASIQSV